MDWEQAYAERRTPWDLGQVTPPLQDLLNGDRLARLGVEPGAHVAVPGCGLGHDLRAWADRGYRVTGFDVVPTAVRDARELLRWNRAPLDRVEVLVRDVLGLGDAFAAAFDVVYEHTCFCALAPHLRPAYGRAIRRLLRPGGLWLGLVFPIDPAGYIERPPYRIAPGDVETSLGVAFRLVDSFPAVGSVPDRAGHEGWRALRLDATGPD